MGHWYAIGETWFNRPQTLCERDSLDDLKTALAGMDDFSDYTLLKIAYSSDADVIVLSKAEMTAFYQDVLDRMVVGSAVRYEQAGNGLNGRM